MLTNINRNNSCYQFDSIRRQYDHEQNSYASRHKAVNKKNHGTKNIRFNTTSILYGGNNYDSYRPRSVSSSTVGTLKSCSTSSTTASTADLSSVTTTDHSSIVSDYSYRSKGPEESLMCLVKEESRLGELYSDSSFSKKIYNYDEHDAITDKEFTTAVKVKSEFQDESSQCSPNTSTTTDSYSEYYGRRRQQSDAVFISSKSLGKQHDESLEIQQDEVYNVIVDCCPTNELLPDCTKDDKLAHSNVGEMDVTKIGRKSIVVTFICGVIYLATNFNLQSCSSVPSFLRQPITGSLLGQVTLSSRRSLKHSLGDLVSSLDTRLVSVEGSEWLDEDEYSMMSLPQYKLSQSTLQTDYVQFVKTWNVTPRYSLNKCYSTHSSDINDMRMSHYTKSTSFGFVPAFSELSLSPEDMNTCLLKASRMNGHLLSVTIETDTHKQIVVKF